MVISVFYIEYVYMFTHCYRCEGFALKKKICSGPVHAIHFKSCVVKQKYIAKKSKQQCLTVEAQFPFAALCIPYIIYQQQQKEYWDKTSKT